MKAFSIKFRFLDAVDHETAQSVGIGCARDLRLLLYVDLFSGNEGILQIIGWLPSYLSDRIS